jgi:hypothetical protein
MKDSNCNQESIQFQRLPVKADFDAMKRVWALALLLASLSCAPVFGQTNLHAHPLSIDQYAPAQESFGPQKMSTLGIRNELFAMDRLYDAHPDKAEAIIGDVAKVEASLRGWEGKYPDDPTRAQYVYEVCRIYQKINLASARQKSLDAQTWLFSRYAQTSYAKDELRRISEHQGRHGENVQPAEK